MVAFLGWIGRAHRGLHGDERRRAVRTCTAERSEAAAAKRRMAGAGYFASRCKAPFRARRKIVGERHCVAGPLAAGSPSQEGRERGPLRRQEKLQIDGTSSGWSTDLIPYTDPDARAQEPGQVSRNELDAQRCTQRVDVEVSQILVEVSKLRRERDRLNRVHLRSVDQAFHRAIAGRIVVTDDVETAQRGRKQDGCEMRGRECCDHWHAGYDAAKR